MMTKKQGKPFTVLSILVLVAIILSSCASAINSNGAHAAGQGTYVSTPAAGSAGGTGGTGTSGSGSVQSPTATATATEKPRGLLPGGELWYDRARLIPMTLTTFALPQDKTLRKHQLQVSRYYLEQMLADPTVQKLLDQLAKSGVHCAYEKAWQHPGKEVDIDVGKEVPGKELYTFSWNEHDGFGATVTDYLGHVTMKMQRQPGDNNGWLLFMDNAPLGQKVPGLVISLGYNNSYKQREYAPWQEFCSGLPYTVYSEKYGKLTRDMLKDPKIAEDLDEYAIAGLIETISYELARSSRGDKGIRQLYYDPAPYMQILSTRNPTNLTFYKENFDRLANPAKAFNRPDLKPVSWENIDFRRLFTSAEYNGLIGHYYQGYWPKDFREKYPELVYYTAYDQKAPLGISYEMDEASHRLLALDNIPPFLSVALPETNFDGKFALMSQPANITSTAFWRKYIFYHQSEFSPNALAKAQGTIHDYMFGDTEPNFVEGYDKPAPFDVLHPDVFRDSKNFPNYGLDAGNPLHMEYLLAELEATPRFGTYKFKGNSNCVGCKGHIPVPFYGNGKVDLTRYFNWAQGEAPLLPTLFFVSNPHNSVHSGYWRETSTTPMLKLYVNYYNKDEIQKMINMGWIKDRDNLRYTVGYWDDDPGKKEYDKTPYYLVSTSAHMLSYGSIFLAGAGRVTDPALAPDQATYSASGEYYYGGVVNFTLIGNVSFGDAKVPFPYKEYKFDNLATFSNPDTGKYTVDADFAKKISDQNIRRLFTGLNVCYSTAEGFDAYFFKKSVLFKRDALAPCLPLVNGEEYKEEGDAAGYWGTDVRFSPSLIDTPLGGWLMYRQADKVNALGGLGEMITHDMIVLTSHNGALLDNPEALARWGKPDWLQKALHDVQTQSKRYDPSGPYFGAYVVPTYAQVVWLIPTDPVCQFDTNCHILSNIYGIGDTQQDVERGTAQGRGYVSGKFREDGAGGILFGPDWWLRANMIYSSYAYNKKPYLMSDLLDSVSFWGEGHLVYDESVEWYNYVTRMAKQFHVHEKGGIPFLTTTPWGYSRDYKLLTEAYDKELSSFEKKRLFDIHYDYVWAVGHIPGGKRSGYIRMAGSIIAPSNVLWFTRSDGKPYPYDDRVVDSERMSHNALGLKTPPEYTKNLEYVLFPDGREMQAMAWLTHSCIPFPHPEQTDCGVKVIEGNEKTWLIPQDARDVDYLVKQINSSKETFLRDVTFGKILEVRHRDENNEPKSLCRFTSFYWAEKWFGRDVAQRMYKYAYQFNVGNPNAEVPEWSCEDNTLKAAPLDPYYNPVLFSILKRGHFGGLPKNWKWYVGLDEDDVWTKYALRVYDFKARKYTDMVLPYYKDYGN